MNWKKLLGLEKPIKENVPKIQSRFPEEVLNYPGQNHTAWDLIESKEYYKAYLLLLEAAFINGQGKHVFSKFKGNIFLDAGRKITPATLNGLKTCIEELNLSQAEVHRNFVHINTATHHQYDFPLHPQDIWHDHLNQELFKQ